MPQVIPAVVAALKATAFTVAGYAVTWGAVLKTVALAATIAYSANQQRRLKRSLGSLKDQGRTVTFQDVAGARQVIYGTVRYGGNRVFAHVTGTKNEYLHVIVAHAGHEVNAIKDVFLGDEIVPLDSSGNATGFYAGLVRVKKHTGADSQTVGTGTLATEAPTVWTANHRLRGVACSEIRFKYNTDKYPNGIEAYSAIIDGKKLYDPRTGTTVFSRNPALVVRDYLANQIYGFGALDAEIDDAAIITASNICDESVGVATSLARTCGIANGDRTVTCSNFTDVVPGLKVTGTGIPANTLILTVDVDGGIFTLSNAATATNASAALTLGDTEPRYTCDGIVDTSVAPMDNLSALLSSMAGWAIFSGGKWRVSAGAHRASSASFGLGDLRGPISVQTSSSRRDACNAIKGIYVSPVNKWQPADFPPVRNGTYEVEDSTQARTATADAATDQFTLASAANVPTAAAVKLSTTGGAPGGITAGTVYFWIAVDSTHGKFATTRANAIAGTAIDLTTAGTGTHTLRFGEVVWRDLELPFTTSPSMAQRLAKIELERTRQDIVVTLPLKLGALKSQAGDVVDLTIDRYGWASKLFEVSEWRFAVDGLPDNPTLGIDIVGRETASGVYDWSSGEETTIDLAPNTSLPDPFTVPTPTGLTLVSGSSTVLIQKDGTAVPRILVAWNTPNNIHVESGGKVRIEYKPNAGGTWFVWAEVRGDALSDYITDVVIATAFDVRVQFENNAGVRGAYATVTSHTVAGDTTAPSALSAPSVTAFPGFNRVQWSKSAAADASEYRVYRNTSNTTAGATLLGETGGLEWDDPTATPGTTYYYFVSVVDGSENEGSASSGTSVVTALAPVGAAVPSNPTAATRVAAGSDDTYLAGDGTVFAFITIAVPSLPTNAVWQNLLYRRNGASDWLVAAQLKNAGSTNVRIDDLTPGVDYEVATQAWSGAGGSAIVTATSSPFTAPNRSTAPANPTGFTAQSPSSSYPVPARFIGSVEAYAATVLFTPSASKQASYYEFAGHSSNVSAPSGPGIRCEASVSHCFHYQGALLPNYLWVRTCDRSGNLSNWAYTGLNMTSYVAVTAGTMAVQNSNAVQTTGITTGGGGSQRKVLARQPILATISLTGGATSESYDLSLSGYGFSSAPDAGWFQAADTSNIEVRYDWDDSSSSIAKLRIRTLDVTNLGTSMIITGELVEYF